MTRRRFYTPPAAFAPDEQTATLSAEETRHLREVLRLHPGDEIFVFDGAGREFQCAIELIEQAGTDLRVIAEVEPTRPESPLDLTLANVLLKGEKFDLVIQKATELGVNRIVPLDSARADMRIKDNQDMHNRTTRWRRIAREAAKQSGRAQVPEIMAPLTFESLLTLSAAEQEGSTNKGLRLMFSERGGASLAEASNNFSEQSNKVEAIVGPEGGWTDEEIELAREGGWNIITLGGRTLRAETAAITIVSLLQHRFGDLV